MKKILEDSKQNPLLAIVSILLFLILILQTITMLNNNTIKGRMDSIESAVTTAKRAINDVENLVDDISDSVYDISTADVLAIRAVQLTSGDTWVIPCASVAWTGN